MEQSTHASFCRIDSMTMNRWATGWFSLFVSLLTTSLNAENSKPNVLILLADNWAAPHASIMGDRSVKTPTFDSIARNGVYFTNAFCQIPSCSPSRAVLLTGRERINSRMLLISGVNFLISNDVSVSLVSLQCQLSSWVYDQLGAGTLSR